jgi:hypothetical protein
MSSDFEVRCRFGSSGVEVVGELEGSMGADVEGWLLGSTTFGVVILSVAAAAISRVKCQRTNKNLDTARHSYYWTHIRILDHIFPFPSRLVFSRLVLLCLVSASFCLSHLDTNVVRYRFGTITKWGIFGQICT